jgi:hypothetical protein
MLRVAVPWLLVVAVLGAAIGVWAMTLGNIVSDHVSSEVVTSTPTFGVREVFISANTLGTTLAELPTK